MAGGPSTFVALLVVVLVVVVILVIACVVRTGTESHEGQNRDDDAGTVGAQRWRGDSRAQYVPPTTPSNHP